MPAHLPALLLACAPAPLLPACHIKLALPCPACPPSQADLLDLGAGRDLQYRYVLVYIELRSRRVWLRPMRTKTAKEVANWVRSMGAGPALQGQMCARCSSCAPSQPHMMGDRSQPRMHDHRPYRPPTCLPTYPPMPCTKPPVLQLMLLWSDLPTPQVLQTDNGLEFCAAAMKELCEEWGVEMKHGQVGNPQTQGAVERANREVKDLIRRLLLACQTAT